MKLPVLISSSLALISAEDVSLVAQPAPDLTSGSAPAYWSAECGDRTYVGSYTLMMDWAKCRDYCTYFPHAAELGHTFSFADILDADTMECLRYNMNSQYTPGNGYDGHYWAGGYRRGDGQYRWDSGAVFEFDDFVGNPGEDPYLHLTPGNNYQWNTKNDQDDRNNGCLCKSQEPASEVEKRDSPCPVGWYSVGEKCIRWTRNNQLSWYESYKYCQHLEAELVTWRSEGEYLTLKYFMNELALEYGPALLTWTGANKPLWNPWNDFIFNNDTMDFVPMTYGWAEGQPWEDNQGQGWLDDSDNCVWQLSTGEMVNRGCGDGDRNMLCQALF